MRPYLRNSDDTLTEEGVRLSNSLYKPKRNNQWRDIPTGNKIVIFIGLLCTAFLFTGMILQGNAVNELRRQQTEKTIKDGTVRTRPYSNYTFKTETDKGTLHGWKYQCIGGNVRDNYNRVILSSEGTALSCTETVITKKTNK